MLYIHNTSDDAGLAFTGERPGAMSLRDLAASQWGVVESVLPPLDGVRRLQALGLCQGRVVEVIRPGDPMIIRVYETKIGLSAQLAGQVVISPCPTSPCPIDPPGRP